MGATARRSHPRAHSRVVDVIDDLEALFEKDQPLLAITGRAPLQHVFGMLSSRLRASCRCPYDPMSHPRLALLPVRALRAPASEGSATPKLASHISFRHTVAGRHTGWVGSQLPPALVGGRAWCVRVRVARCTEAAGGSVPPALVGRSQRAVEGYQEPPATPGIHWRTEPNNHLASAAAGLGSPQTCLIAFRNSAVRRTGTRTARTWTSFRNVSRSSSASPHRPFFPSTLQRM